MFRLKISNLSESTDVPPPIDCNEEDSDDTDELGTNAGLLRFGNSFYAFLTPFILIIGLIGNSMSLKVFTSRVMRRLSSSIYLMALSVSDMLVLLTYVLLDWLNDGLKYWPGGYRFDTISAFIILRIMSYLHPMNKVQSKTLLRICLATVKGIANVKVKMFFFIP